MRNAFHILVVLAAGLLPVSAHADKIQIIRKGDTTLVIPQTQKLMLSASQHVLKEEYKEAEKIYSQVLTLDKDNIQAYIQRGVVRREMKDTMGTRADARSAINLINTKLGQSPNNAKLYYQRGSALRLLNAYKDARVDIEKALSLPGAQESWRSDLQAISLEEKFNQ